MLKMTRATSSSKLKSSGRKQSKYAHLRRKLTLNSKCSPGMVRKEDEQLIQEECLANQDQPSRVLPVKVEENTMTESKKFFQRASPMKMVRLYPKLTEEQKLLIQRADYGGLLDIKCSKLHPGLCQFLVESFDPVTCQLVFPGRGAIPVNTESVHTVLGVPMGSLDVMFKRDVSATAFMKEQLGYAGRKQPTITSLEKKLENMRPANSKFLRLFITYAMSSVLAPTTGIRISSRVYPSLVNIKDAKNLNMAKFVIMILCKALSTDSEKEQVSPCMLFLMVKYLDSLQLKDMEVSSEGTRVSVWTNAMVRKAIKQDTKQNGSFGAAPLKPEFAQDEESSDDRTMTDESGNIMSEDTSHADLNQNNDETLDEDPEQSMSIPVKCDEAVDPQHSTSAARDSEKSNSVKEKYYPDNEEYVQMPQSILFDDPVKILKFIDKNAPQDRTPEETARYVEAIEYACHGFESSLQMLVRNFGSSKNTTTESAKAPSNAQPKILPNPEKNTSAPVEDGVSLGSRNGSDAPTSTTPIEPDVPVGNSIGEATANNSVEEQTEIAAEEKTESGVDLAATLFFNGSDNKENQTTEMIHHEKESGVRLETATHVTSADVTRTDIASAEKTESGEDLTVTPSFVKSGLDNKENQTTEMIEHEKESEVTLEKATHVISADVTSTGISVKEMFLSEPTSLSTSGVDCMQNEEDQKRKEFLEFVGSKRQVDANITHIPKLELPVFLDMDTETETGMQGILKHTQIIEPTMDGLTSLIDGTLRPESEQLLKEMEQSIIGVKRKSVTFTDEKHKKAKNTTAPSPSKYRTRSAVRSETLNSPLKTNSNNNAIPDAVSLGGTPSRQKLNGQQASPTHSATRRQTRLQSIKVNTPMFEDNSAPKKLTTCVPSSAHNDPMYKKLDFDSTESDRRKEALRRGPDPPSFDLDTPPDEYDQITEHAEDAGCSKVIPKQQSSSITPIAHEYNKRVVKQGKFGKSPFVNPQSQKPFFVSKPVDELYRMVCQHGWKGAPKDPDNGETVIDMDDIYVHLGDLADSVAPRHQLVNIVAEVAISIIQKENQNPNKFIMPLRVSEYIISKRFHLKDVTRCFAYGNRLDQKDIICFPTLQKFPGLPKDSSGHYWLVNINIKAQRFEIYDSLASNGEPLMMDTCHFLIGHLKSLWAKEYKNSKLQILDWPIEVIDCPKQTNTFDCGFFTLKNLEACPTRMPATFSQKDIPNIRKLYTDKWLRFDNKAEWQLYV